MDGVRVRRVPRINWHILFLFTLCLFLSPLPNQAAEELLDKTGTVIQLLPGNSGQVTASWLIDYGNDSSKILYDVKLTDILSEGQTIIPGSIRLPQDWDWQPINSTTNIFTTPLVVPRNQGIGKNLTIPPGSAVYIGGNGDGYNPAQLANGRIMGVNHHLPDPNFPAIKPSVWCYDPLRGDRCENDGYPHDVEITTHDVPETVAVGNRLYINASADNFYRTPGIIYCWDGVTHARCPDSSLIGRFAGPRAVDKKLYVLRNDGYLLCLDPVRNLVACENFTSVNTGVVFTDDDRKKFEEHAGMYVIGTRIYLAASVLNCFDTVSQAVCKGWPMSGIANPYGPQSYGLFPRLNANGLTTGICIGQAEHTGSNSGTCYDLDGANPYSKIFTGVDNMPAYMTAPFGAGTFGSRVVLLSTMFSHNDLNCWDWATDAYCTGSEWNKHAIDAQVPYGILDDDACIITYGDQRVLNSFDPATGKSPCRRTAVDRSLKLEGYYDCSDGIPPDVSWHQVKLYDVDLRKGIEFIQLTVKIIDPLTGKIVFGPKDALDQGTNNNGVFDISSISPSYRELELQINGATNDTVPWDDGIGPKALFTFFSSAPTQFCFSTTKNISCPGGGVLSNQIGSSVTNTKIDASVNGCAPSPVVTLSATPRIPEGKNAIVTATLDIPAAVPVRIFLGYRDIAAISGTDYTSSPLEMIIPAGQLSANVTVATLQDTVVEPDESFQIRIIRSINAINGSTLQTVTIVDDDLPVVTLSATPKVPEGKTATVTASLNTSGLLPVTVNLRYTDSTATAGKDYTPAPLQIVIPAGRLSASIDVATLQDSIYEGDETFQVGITSLMNAIDGSMPQTITIQDDDEAPSVTLSTQTCVQEGQNVWITAFLNKPSLLPVTVTLRYIDGTALKGKDYTGGTLQIVIPSGATRADVTDATLQDTLIEPSETYQVVIASVSNAKDASTPQTVTIYDRDYTPPTAVTVSLHVSAKVKEGESATVTVSLNRASTQTVTVTLIYTDGTAIRGKDYLPGLLTITIPPGSTSFSTKVPTLLDNLFEGDEAFGVKIGKAINAENRGTLSQAVVIIDASKSAPYIFPANRSALTISPPSATNCR